MQSLGKDKSGNYDFKKMIMSLSDNDKIRILHDDNILEEYGLGCYDIKDIIVSLNDKIKIDLLLNKDFVNNQLNLEGYIIAIIVASLEDEKVKLEMIQTYELVNYQVAIVLATFSSNETKKLALLENKYNFYKSNIIELIVSMDMEALIDFLKGNKDYLDKNDVRIYRVIKELDSNKQLEFISKLEEFELTNRRNKANFSQFR